MENPENIYRLISPATRALSLEEINKYESGQRDEMFECRTQSTPKTSDNSGSPSCDVFLDNLVTLEIGCSTPGYATLLQSTCRKFNKKFPHGLARQGLFDQACKYAKETPLTDIENIAPLNLLHTTKSYLVFDQTADAIIRDYPEIISDGKLSVLYPGSGVHIAPYLTARALLDKGAIQEATYTYTELNPDLLTELKEAFSLINDQLARAKRPPLYDNLLLDQAANTLTLTYKGKPIVFKASVRNDASPKACDDLDICAYFNKDEFDTADLIIVHDSYDAGIFVPSLLRLQQHWGDKRKRLVLFGAETGISERDTNFYGTSIISGPYGHGGMGAFDLSELVAQPPSFLQNHLLSLNQQVVLGDIRVFTYFGENGEIVSNFDSLVSTWLDLQKQGETELLDKITLFIFDDFPQLFNPKNQSRFSKHPHFSEFVKRLRQRAQNLGLIQPDNDDNIILTDENRQRADNIKELSQRHRLVNMPCHGFIEPQNHASHMIKPMQF